MSSSPPTVASHLNNATLPLRSLVVLLRFIRTHKLKDNMNTSVSLYVLNVEHKWALSKGRKWHHFAVLQPLNQEKTTLEDIQNLRRYLVSYHDIDILLIYCSARPWCATSHRAHQEHTVTSTHADTSVSLQEYFWSQITLFILIFNVYLYHVLKWLFPEIRSHPIMKDRGFKLYLNC